MRVTHQGEVRSWLTLPVALCWEQVTGLSVTRVSLTRDEVIPWHPQSTLRPSYESGNYAEILYVNNETRDGNAACSGWGSHRLLLGTPLKSSGQVGT